MRLRIAGMQVLIAVTALLAGSAAEAQMLLPKQEGPQGLKHTPVVVAIAAQNEIREGAMWKIYVRATDPDGDLDKVHVTFSQSGGGEITNSLLPQKKTRDLNGYILVWARLEGTARNISTVQATVEIRVEDRAGNMSEPKKLDFEVGDFNKEDRFRPPPPFSTSNKLGQAEFGLLTEDENVGDDKFN